MGENMCYVGVEGVGNEAYLQDAAAGGRRLYVWLQRNETERNEMK